MIYKRHLVQYNDLVFDEADMIAEDDSSASFKSFGKSYSFSHGEYSPYKRKGGLLRPSSISATITLRMKKLPCEYRPFYKEFAMGQLTTQGKLWSVQNNTLMWAYAHLESIRESQKARKDTVEFDVDFTLPEGVWHKADKHKTFLVPFDKCEFMDCYNFKDINPCSSGVRCEDTTPKYCNCCECNDLTKDMALCYQIERGCCKDGLQMFYACDGAGYRIVYDCSAAERFFGDFLSSDRMGHKFCTNCGPVAGLLYSQTEIPTDGVSITLHGKITNPYIEINGNGNTIKGEFDGTLEINSDGSVYYSSCGDCEPLPVDRWVVPQGMSYGWTVNQGNNRLIIQGSCCGAFCAYVTIDELAI